MGNNVPKATIGTKGTWAQPLTMLGELCDKALVRRIVHPLRPSTAYLAFKPLDLLGEPRIVAQQAAAINEPVARSAFPTVLLGNELLHRPPAPRTQCIRLTAPQARVLQDDLNPDFAGVRFNSARGAVLEGHVHYIIEPRDDLPATDHALGRITPDKPAMAYVKRLIERGDG